MKATILAAVAALAFGTGVASAQGLPPGYAPPAYGSTWAAKEQAAKANAGSSAQATRPDAPKAANNIASETANHA